ncbi:hypothetical protein EHS13_11605 [Paenibacillus psychroresistens]|uniref:Uncharacterized protein n=1 Tax=Paenibacillus psychroresistens TaxID=1778678 RepID=A0A6B8RIW6_9BACL|nr:hypothetical protein EHS13_11605 [Paenibacillus psychroresistens]
MKKPELLVTTGSIAEIRVLIQAGADAVIFGDPAVLMATRNAAVAIPMHWNPEMMTNIFHSKRNMVSNYRS